MKIWYYIRTFTLSVPKADIPNINFASFRENQLFLKRLGSDSDKELWFFRGELFKK